MANDRASMSPLLIAAAAFLSVAYQRVPSDRLPAGDIGGPAPPPARKVTSFQAPQSAAAPSSCYHDARALAREFIGNQAEIPKDTEFLIATVPDPIDAHAGWEFDSYVDAIQRAAESKQYVLDRYFFPWECDREVLAKAERDANPAIARTLAPVLANAAGAQHHDEPEEDGRLRESQPGILLFRHIDRPQSGLLPKTAPVKLLIVFLVGETPTAGIHKTAFENAVDEAASMAPAQPLRIVGPGFSGSSESLHVAIQDWVCTHPLPTSLSPPAHAFNVKSGAAVVRRNQSILEAPLDCGPAKQPIGGVVAFSATVHPDDAVQQAVQEYLGMTDPGARVAVLTEGSSAYGQSLVVPTPGATPASANPTPKPWLWLPFPMHISQVRAAAARREGHNARSGADSAPIRDAIDNAHRPAIELSLDDAEQANDVPMALHPEISSAESELAIANILAAIGRNGVQYVGILATDVRDTLFLARQIHKNCPDVRLFTFENSLLFTYPEYQDDLQGMIVASTYPLWPETQYALTARRLNRLFQFSSNGAEGVYNATVALLSGAGSSGDDAFLDYSIPLGMSKSTPPAPKGADSAMPPVWLSVVGHGSVWPVRFFPTCEASGKPEGCVEAQGYLWAPIQSPSTTPTPTPTYGPGFNIISHRPFSLTLFAALAVACFAAGVGYFLVVYGRCDWRMFALFRPLSPVRGRHWQATYTFGCMFILIIVYAYFARIVLLARTVDRQVIGPQPYDPFVAPLLLLPILPLLAAAVRENLAALGVDLSYEPRMSNAWAYAPVMAVLIVLWWGVADAAGLPPMTSSFEPLDAFLLLNRALTSSSGLSPLLPVLFLGSAWFVLSLCHLRRIDLHGRREVHTPLFVASGRAAAGIRALEDHVSQTLRLPLRGLMRLIVAMLIMGPLALYLNSRFQSFEPITYTALFGLAGGFACLLTLLVFLHFLAVWRRFQRYLRRLPLHPMVEAYSRLPKRPQAFGGDFAAHAPTLPDLELSMAYWSLLTKTFGNLPKEWRDSQPDLTRYVASTPKWREDFDRELNRAAGCSDDEMKVAGGFDDDVLSTKTVGRLDEVGTALMGVLDQFWKGAPLVGEGAHTTDAIPLATETVHLYGEIVGSDGLGRWLRLAEDFIAVQVVSFINSIFAHLRNLLGSVMVSLFLLLLAFTSYPFEPQKLLLTVISVFIVAVVVAGVVVFVQVERDEILSRIAGTEPNKVTFSRSFIAPLFVYAGLPLAVLAATYFPPLGDVFSFADPLLRVLR